MEKRLLAAWIAADKRIVYLEACAKARSEAIRKRCYARPCGLDRKVCRTCVERTHPLEGKARKEVGDE